MLIAALVMAVIGLAALVTAVVTHNEVIAWVCIVASAIGVILLIVDAVRERQRRESEAAGPAAYSEERAQGETAEPEPDSEPEPEGRFDAEQFDAEYPEETSEATYPDETSETSETTDRDR